MCRYTAHRFISTLGAFGFAGQMYRTSIRFYVTCSKEVGVVNDVVIMSCYAIFRLRTILLIRTKMEFFIK